MQRALLLGLALLTSGCNKADASLTEFKNCDGFDRYMKKMAKRETAFNWNYHGGLVGGIGRNGGFAESDSLEAPTATQDEADGVSTGPIQYSETNVQEEGIDEDDLMKTDGTLLYAVAGGELVISTLFPLEEAAQLSTHDIDGAPTGLFLVGNHVYVLSNLYWNRPSPTSGAVTPWREVSGASLTVFDVTNPSEPQLTRQTYWTGSMRDARIVDGTMYVVTYEDLIVGEWEGTQVDALRAIKDAEPADYQTLRLDNRLIDGVWDVDEGPACNCEDTYASIKLGGTYITTVSAFDLSNATAPARASSVVGQADTIYASDRSLYVAYVDRPDTAFNGRNIPQDTVIHAFDVSENFAEYTATAYVEGAMTDQFAIKDKSGTLFVATTEMTELTSGLTALQEKSGTFEQVGFIGDLAPGETITAARFVGDIAYLVTWEVQLGDPLFTIDISDPQDLRLGGELAVTGWSDYLHPMGDNHLLALGMEQVGDNWDFDLSVSIFDVSDISDPRLQDRITLDAWNSESQNEHHAFNYFPPTQSLSIPSWRNEGSSVLEVIHADPTEELKSRGRIAPNFSGDSWCTNVRRSVIINETVWAVSDAGLVAADVYDPTDIQATISYAGIDPCASDEWGWGREEEW
jgi:uncharacterized secreted protein with C-terminal beta-propeller domain